MGTVDVVGLLQQVEFFQGCTESQLTDIAKLLEDRHLQPGDTLCTQGDFETEVFVLVAGEASVTIDGSRVATVGAGEVVGEFAMEHGGKRSATLQATTPLHVLVLDPREIDSVLMSDPHSADKLGPRHPG